MKGSNWISDKRPQLRGLFYIMVYSALSFRQRSEPVSFILAKLASRLRMASEKMSDFLILKHKKNERIFPRHEHKNEGIDVFSFLSTYVIYHRDFLSAKKNQVQLAKQKSSFFSIFRFSLQFFAEDRLHGNPALRHRAADRNADEVFRIIARKEAA